MVQTIASQGHGNFGGINRVGTTDNGRIVYQITDGMGQVAGNISIQQKDCDKFERSYRDIIENAPKLQKYMETTTPEEMEKKQKASKWIVAGGALLGGIVPLLKVKGGGGFWGFAKTAGVTLLGLVAGLLGGSFIAAKTTTPPGATKFAKATQTISQMDIQPVQVAKGQGPAAQMQNKIPTQR